MEKFKEYVSYVLTGLIHIGAGVIVYIITSNILLSVATIFLVMLAVDVSLVECKDVISDIFKQIKGNKKRASKNSKKRYVQCKKNFEELKISIRPLTDYSTASIIISCENVLKFIKANNSTEKVDNLENIFLENIPEVISAIKRYLKLKESNLEAEFNEDFTNLLDRFKKLVDTEYDKSVSNMKNIFSSCIPDLQSTNSNNTDSEDN